MPFLWLHDVYKPMYFILCTAKRRIIEYAGIYQQQEYYPITFINKLKCQ